MVKKSELNVPPDVEANGGTEILRLFVTDGVLSLTMQRSFAKPEVWGKLLAELARHVSTAYHETPIGAAKAQAEIRSALDMALDRMATRPAMMH